MNMIKKNSLNIPRKENSREYKIKSQKTDVNKQIHAALQI